MFGQYTYLIWLALCMGVPLLALLRWRTIVWQQRRALAWVTLGSLAGGWLWDALAVRRGVWFYAPEHIANIWLLGLPVEEWIWIAGITLLFGALTVVLAEAEGRV